MRGVDADTRRAIAEKSEQPVRQRMAQAANAYSGYADAKRALLRFVRELAVNDTPRRRHGQTGMPVHAEPPRHLAERGAHDIDDEFIGERITRPVRAKGIDDHAMF